MTMTCTCMTMTRTLSKARCHALRTLAAGLLLATAGGCAEAKPERVAVYPVAGKITFQGQPAHGALITLHPKGGPLENVPTPRANVGPDGAFRVTTFDGGDGAPAGEYVLTVQWYKPVKRGADIVAGPNVIPRKYAAPESSGKVVTIAAGPNDLQTIQL